MTRLTALAAMSAALLGCGGAAERDCPAPIGRIVLEDCDVYQRRFEALRVDLVALVGQVRIDVGVDRRRLRPAAGPDQALEVLSHRLHTLCRDHNACRVTGEAWQADRLRLDETVTALTVIRDRLKDEVDPEARAALLGEFQRVLRGPAGLEDRVRRAHYSSWLPWFGAAHRPPQPDPPVGSPMLVGADFDTSARFVRGQGRVGYGPSARFDLWWPGAAEAPNSSSGAQPATVSGAFQIDDALVVEWPGAVRSACPIRGRGNGDDHRSVSCAAPDTVVSTADRIAVRAWYRTGIDGAEHALGAIEAPVIAHRVDGPDRSPTWDVDLDPIARQGWLIWRPADGALPATVDQPSLGVVLKLRDYARPTARCRISGEDAFGVLKPTRYSGQEGTHQDRPRYRMVAPNHSQGVAHPFVEWWRYDFALPLGVPRDGAALPEGLAPWPRPGEWRCTVTLDGEPIRRMRFTVRPDGQLDLHPDQLGRARDRWLLETTVVPSSVEEPLKWPR